MKLHVPSIPWTQTTKRYLSCAYTQKVVKFCQMMLSLGHEVILYSGEENEAPCSKHHVVISKKEQREWFGNFKPEDTSTQASITWDVNHVSWATMNERIVNLMKDCDGKDIFCPIMGADHLPIASHYPHLSVAEWGIGYEGVVTRDRWHWCFESEAWRHYIYGKQNIVNGRNYDVVIPNSFDPQDFKYSGKRGDYLLYLGRVVTRKGPHIGALIAEKLGMRYIVAGPGGKQVAFNKVRSEEQGLEFKGEYVGSVGVEDRAELLSNAAALIVPTIYVEPFGGVACEAMLSGTPVVASDYGAFTETIRPGISGYRFHSLPEGCAAVEKAMELNRSEVRMFAERFSIWQVRFQYDRWLKSIHGLFADGTGIGDWYGNGAAQVASTSIVE